MFPNKKVLFRGFRKGQKVNIEYLRLCKAASPEEKLDWLDAMVRLAQQRKKKQKK